MLKLSTLGVWYYIFLLIDPVTLLGTVVHNLLHNHIIVSFIHCHDSQTELGSSANDPSLSCFQQ